MKKGDRGPEVKALQMKLNKVLQINLVCDGIYGTKTEKAVKAYKNLNDIIADRICCKFTKMFMDRDIKRLREKEESNMLDAFHFALGFYGLKEIKGNEHNPIIVNMFAGIGHSWVKDDEMAWCAVFVNYCLKMTGYEHTGKLNARSFLEIGYEVKKPKLGDIMVLWRNGMDSPFGHVTFFVSEGKDHYYGFGGNQSNMAKISKYEDSRILSIRRMNKLTTK